MSGTGPPNSGAQGTIRSKANGKLSSWSSLLLFDTLQESLGCTAIPGKMSKCYSLPSQSVNVIKF